MVLFVLTVELFFISCVCVLFTKTADKQRPQIYVKFLTFTYFKFFSNSF